MIIDLEVLVTSLMAKTVHVMLGTLAKVISYPPKTPHLTFLGIWKRRFLGFVRSCVVAIPPFFP